MREWISILLILVMLTNLLGTPSSSGYISEAVYRLYLDGTATITLFLAVPPNSDIINISLEPGYIGGSIVALTPNGTPLYVGVRDSTAMVEVYNLTSRLILTYNARIGNVSGNVLVTDLIHLKSTALVVLPRDSALVNASGKPQVSLSNRSISLLYLKPGTYEIAFIILPPLLSPTPKGGFSTSASKPIPFEGSILKFLGLPFWITISVIFSAFLITYLLIARCRKAKISISLREGLDERDMMILKALSGEEKSVSELSRILGLNKSVVWRRVRRLRGLGLLSMRVEKGKTIYGLTDSGLRVIRKDLRK